MSADHDPEPRPGPRKPRPPLGKPGKDGLEFAVSEPSGVRLPQFDDWPELGEPPVLIEPYGVRVYRMDNTGSGPTHLGRPISRVWVYDLSGATRSFKFGEFDHLVPDATRAARAARASNAPPADPPATAPGTAPSPAG